MTFIGIVLNVCSFFRNCLIARYTRDNKVENRHLLNQSKIHGTSKKSNENGREIEIET